MKQKNYAAILFLLLQEYLLNKINCEFIEMCIYALELLRDIFLYTLRHYQLYIKACISHTLRLHSIKAK